MAGEKLSLRVFFRGLFLGFVGRVGLLTGLKFAVCSSAPNVAAAPPIYSKLLTSLFDKLIEQALMLLAKLGPGQGEVFVNRYHIAQSPPRQFDNCARGLIGQTLGKERSQTRCKTQAWENLLFW